MQTLNPIEEAQQEFKKAIRASRLSDWRECNHYAGQYMYMGKDKNGLAMFKNINTREYLQPHNQRIN